MLITGFMFSISKIDVKFKIMRVLNYDLAEFFRRNTEAIKNEVRIVLETLLSGR